MSKQNDEALLEMTRQRDEWRALYEQTDPNAPHELCNCNIGDCVRFCRKCRQLGSISETAMSALDGIAAERRRQIEVEGWSPEHDDRHDSGELAEAAACYAAHKPIYYGRTSEPPFMRRPRQGATREPHGPYLQVEPVWPWPEPINKEAQRRRDLVKAGALIIAEIERLDRAQQGGDR